LPLAEETISAARWSGPTNLTRRIRERQTDRPLDEPDYERWRAAAETAYRSALAQSVAGFFGWACFMCEQSAQFALKALIHGVGV
jgi:hypothetical protein